MDIRLERPEEHGAVENLTREAFWNVHVPGCDEHYLAHILRDAPAFIPELDFVALEDGKLVGNILYSRAWVERADGSQWDVILFGPISVLPDYQGRGIGGALIRHTAQVARQLGYPAIFLYGDPAYYQRFGFRPASDFGITPPDGVPHVALQVLLLMDGIMEGNAGRFYEDPIYETIDAKDVEAFDAAFPPKEKAVTESQRRFAQLSGGDVSS